jgi:hypothetical protein
MVILTIVITEDGPKYVNLTTHLIEREATPNENEIAEALNALIAADLHQQQPNQANGKHHH